MSKDWLNVLREEIAKPGRSGASVARELGVSNSKLSQIVRGIYPGSDEDVRLKVIDLYMDAQVICPVKGKISIKECYEHQRRPFSSANRERIRMHRACRSGCPHSELEQTCNSKQVELKIEMSESYDIQRQIAFITSKANGDIEVKAALLQKELERLAARYNQLVWKTKYQ